ncbi:unnamed protein product, partial [Iphiclides podalirius]
MKKKPRNPERNGKRRPDISKDSRHPRRHTLRRLVIDFHPSGMLACRVYALYKNSLPLRTVLRAISRVACGLVVGLAVHCDPQSIRQIPFSGGVKASEPLPGATTGPCPPHNARRRAEARRPPEQ